MAIKIVGAVSAVEADVDSNRNLKVTEGLPAHPSAGGWYSVAGGPAGIVAAGLAADTSLVALRFSTGSTRKAQVSKFTILICGATIGVSAGVGGAIGLQRFTAATPSGGTARTVNEMNPALDSTSDMTSVQDLASALTMTSVVFGTEVAWTRVPLFINGAMWYEWTFEPKYPIVLTAGDGLVLRTRVALAATQTWVYAWTCTWKEE